MRILIADDHQLLRKGLAFLVKEEYPGAELSEAANESEVYGHLHQHNYDMMLMDLNMPNTDSMALMQQSLTLLPNLKILIISGNPERLYAIRYLKAGAAGYVQKSETEATIKKAIRLVMSGSTFLSVAMIDVMGLYLKSGSTVNPFDKLSKREFEVALHCIKGLTTNEISHTMTIQPPTVSIYKSRIFYKLSIKNIHDLVAMAKEYEM